MAIIDYLTAYTTFKRIEKTAKGLVADKATVSVAHPDFYGDRFREFMINKVF